MLTSIQKELIKNIFRQIFPPEQAECESIMFDFGYAIASKDEQSLKEVTSVLISKGVPQEQLNKLIEAI